MFIKPGKPFNNKRTRSLRYRPRKQTSRFEMLEPLIMLNADTGYVRGQDVSSASVMFEVTEDGDTRQVSMFTPVFQMNEARDFSGEDGDHFEVANQPEFQIAEGTVSLRFTADDVFGYHTLFSKDASGQEVGGHITAFVANGRVKVRLQSTTESIYLWTHEGSVENGETHHLAITFGNDGFWLYLDGMMEDWKLGFTQGIETNQENLVLGANIWDRSPEHPDRASSHFDGRIDNFALFDQQFDRGTVSDLADSRYEPPRVPGRIYGTGYDEMLTGQDVHGGYGDDYLQGTDGDDRLDGGHGEDRLHGGPGDDLLISRSDGREPIIAQDYTNEDDPDGEVNDETRTLYPYQPIEGDDVLVGGPGADTFRFEPLINAKEEIILKHVHDHGMINWHGVAGENDRVHDHWVDRLGNEVIEDFNRAEGDKIEIVGHTIDLYDVQHVDTDGDGILDASVLYLQSNQGNAGAHNKDQIGTITVFGDLVVGSDYTVDAGPAYGIVDSVHQIDEAIEPLVGTPVSEDGTPPLFPTPNDGTLPDGAVFGMLNEVDFTGERGDHIEVAHSDAFAVDAGTFELTFTADTAWGSRALFSKDAGGNRDGGHITAFVYDGRIKVRLQSATDEVWLRSAEHSIDHGTEHHVAVTFGDDGFWLYLNGRMVDWETDFEQGLALNTESMAIGANAWYRDADHPRSTSSHFDGRIRDFVFYDSQFDRNQVADLAGYVHQPVQVEGRTYGTDADETISGTDVDASYGDDTVQGTSGNDRLDGGHGEDRLEGGDGDDLLVSRSDGREPVIAQDYDSEDDPDNEVYPESRTLYPDQPIEADDVMVGGGGADTFRFEVLINAKEEIILDHVMDNGMIHWHGVAGENDRVHDHWVDRLGDEVIEDFNRAEGDRIEVVGHTVDVYHLEHVDTDGDGILDASVLYIQSNQGNAGAHNKDQLGTITVFGDLVTRSDYTVDAQPAYGIVDTIYELDEALAPRKGTPVADDGTPPPMPTPNDGSLPTDGVFGVLNEIELVGEQGDHIEIAHDASMELANGTIEMTFTSDDIWGRHALFSKDARDKGNGGHLSVYIQDGHIEARLQSAEESSWLKSTEGSVLRGQEYHLAVTFGAGGFTLYLNGQPVDIEAGFTQGMSTNMEAMAIGANTWDRTEDRPFKAYDHFNGRISDFVMYDRQMSASEIAGLAAN